MNKRKSTDQKSGPHKKKSRTAVEKLMKAEVADSSSDQNSHRIDWAARKRFLEEVPVDSQLVGEVKAALIDSIVNVSHEFMRDDQHGVPPLFLYHDMGALLESVCKGSPLTFFYKVAANDVDNKALLDLFDPETDSMIMIQYSYYGPTGFNYTHAQQGLRQKMLYQWRESFSSDLTELLGMRVSLSFANAFFKGTPMLYKK